jgi:SAM-dependent methyltransferase
MIDSNEAIHDAVRERYAAIARSTGQSASCCEPSNVVSLDNIGAEADCCGTDSHANRLYEDTSLAGLPVDVTGLSLGCGDPVAIAGLNPGETVVDLGSGGGIDCFLAAQQVGESGHVIGVDMTQDMLDKANANKDKMGVTNVEFRKGQIESLPVDDNTVDVIMSNCVINLSPDKSAVFRDAFRVLKPGGRVSISDIVTEGDFSEELRADASQWAGCISGAIDVDDYTGMMRQAGYVDIQVVDKVSSDDRGVNVDRQEGVPRLFSARVTARKPE